MMEDLIKAFTTYAGPDTDSQRKQYQRMLDLTRSAANACTGLYGEKLENRELFVDLHLAELKAMAYSNDRNGIKAKYCRFQTAIQQYRNEKCCKVQCRANVLATETTLLEAIHNLETESWLDRLGYIVLLSIGMPLFAIAFVVIVLALGHIEPPDWLTQVIDDALPTALNDSLRLLFFLVLPVITILVTLLLLKRGLSDLRRQFRLGVIKSQCRGKRNGCNSTEGVHHPERHTSRDPVGDPPAV